MKGVIAVIVVGWMVAASAYAAESTWFGTWKLNREKSTMIGDTYTISKVGGRYREDNGVQQFDFTEDGRDYPMMPMRTIRLEKIGAGEWLQIRETNGKETSRSRIRLSPDGRTLTSQTTGTMADGTQFSKEVVDRRVGVGAGLVGTWKTSSDSSSEPETVIYSDAGNGAMRMQSVERKSASITHFDGQPSEEVGSQIGPKQALAITATSPTSYTGVLSLDGKPIAEGKNAIAPDGKSFTEVNWLVG